jgi:hypothetical protein
VRGEEEENATLPVREARKGKERNDNYTIT